MIIYKHTKAEQAKIQALEERYERLINECEAEIERLRDDDLDPDGSMEDAIQAKRLPEPTELRPAPVEYTKKGEPVYSKEALEAYYATPEYQAYKAANDAANDEIRTMFDEWEAAGSEEWRAARKRRLELIDELTTARRQLYSQFEQRQFSELRGDPERIIADARKQIELCIKNRYEDAKRQQKAGEIFRIYYLRVDGDKLYIDSETLIEDSNSLLKLHYDFFRNDTEATKTIKGIVLEVIASSPYADSKGVLGGMVNKGREPKPVARVSGNIQTKAPKTWVTPVDKVSNLAFDGASVLYNPKLVGVQLNGRKSKKEILSMVSIDFSDKTIQIHGRKELNPYDREVHDALVTLFVDGENEYITPQMIYRAITGNNNAKLMPKQQEAISNSLNKLMYSRLVIKASKEECAAYGFDKFSYEGTVIQGEKVTATINGVEVVEVYHLLKEPVLYTYASKKKQIGRLDIKLLDSPINKNEENITLQSYLYRRILAIKASSKLSPTIVYDTVYKQLDIEAASDGALRKKKLKVRNTVKKILDYWKAQGFIKGYSENSHKTEIVSVTIRY